MFALIALLSLSPQEVPPTTTLEEVVVLGRSTPPEPFEVFRAVCLDANRLEGRAFRPVDVPRWSPAPGATYAPQGAGGEVFIRRDGDLEMVLGIREGPDERRDHVRRNECSLTLVGPHDQTSLERGMSRAFGRPGLTSHLYFPDRFPTYPGWTQRLWSAWPERGASIWRATEGYTIVTDPAFYQRWNYVVAELRYTVDGDRPVSHITLSYLTRDDPGPRPSGSLPEPGAE